MNTSKSTKSDTENNDLGRVINLIGDTNMIFKKSRLPQEQDKFTR